MKKSYIKVIVITSIITAVFTVGILTLTNTLAIGNNNIYTRDELSEKVDGLEETKELNNNKGNYISLTKALNSSGLSLNTDIVLDAFTCSYTDSELFSCDEDYIYINKTGLYRIDIYAEAVFSSLPGTLIMKVKKNDVDFFHVPLNSEGYNNNSNSRNSAAMLTAGTKINLSIVTQNHFSNSYFNIIVEYFSDSVSIR